MPAVIDNIYDQFCTEISALLTSYVRLPNPYQIESNTYLHLKQGFGIAIGPGTRTEREIGCRFSWERLFTVILVRKVTTTQNNTSQRSGIEQEILTDQDIIVKWFENNQTLSGNTNLIRVDSDSGINFIDAGDLKFLSMDINIFVEYFDSP